MASISTVDQLIAQKSWKNCKESLELVSLLATCGFTDLTELEAKKWKMSFSIQVASYLNSSKQGKLVTEIMVKASLQSLAFKH